MTYYTNIEEWILLGSQFAELHIIYQITIVAISLFMVAMAFAFAYNMVHLAYTFVSETVKMVIELAEKMVKDLKKTLDSLLNVKSTPVEV
jgi:hypothetical protein